MSKAACLGLVGALGLVWTGVGKVDPKPPRSMLVGSLKLPGEPFLEFVEQIRPSMVVMGAFGAPQWAAQKDSGAWLDQWKTIFDRMHRSGIKVVGMIELLNVGNTVPESERWLEFYDNRWNVKLLGRRPAVAGSTLLEKRKMPVELQRGAHAPRGCASNPHWRTVEKALVKALVEAGIDGFITHRNIFGECGCDSCHAGFCKWLTDRYDNMEIKSRFGITNLRTRKLPHFYGQHREHERLPTALEQEGMQFARHQVKGCFDEVFVRFGRSLKPDLLVAQWNHMPYFDELHLDDGHIPKWPLTTFGHASADERWSLPPALWGKGEDFYWYCNWGTCQNTQLDKKFVADVTLYGKLLRSQARGRPYVLNKYDFFRPRNMLAEAAALGMIPGAIAVPHGSKEDRKVMASWFRFLDGHKALYRNSNGESLAKALLVYPRTTTHAGRAGGLEMIEVAGRSMVVDHVQFDFMPDDLLPTVDLKKYRVVVAAEPDGLEQSQLESFVKAGGKLIAVPRSDDLSANLRWKKLAAMVVPGLTPHTGGKPASAPFQKALRLAMDTPILQTNAPYTLEAHVYRQPGRLVVHLVNYNHTEKAPGKSVVAREAPIDVKPTDFRLDLPAGAKARRVRFLDPDAKGEKALQFQPTATGLRFRTPSFKVYGVCVLELEGRQ